MGRALIAMAHSMGIETTVFNVDTEGQAQWFREIGCDALQGPYVGGLEQIPRTNTQNEYRTRYHFPRHGSTYGRVVLTGRTQSSSSITPNDGVNRHCRFNVLFRTTIP